MEGGQRGKRWDNCNSINNNKNKREIRILSPKALLEVHVYHAKPKT